MTTTSRAPDQLAMQSETARKIYGALGGSFGKIFKTEMEKAWRKPEPDLTDYDYYLRARSYMAPDTLESLARARQVAEKGLARFPGSPALNLLTAGAFLNEQTDDGPFVDCHEKFAIAWKYAGEADKTKNKSRWLAHYHHWVTAKFSIPCTPGTSTGAYRRPKHLTMEMAPNEVLTRSSLSDWLSFAEEEHDQAIEWASAAFRQEHNAEATMFLQTESCLEFFISLAGMTKRLRPLRAAKWLRRTLRR